MLITAADYMFEIDRIQKELEKVLSPRRRKDLGRYLKRLKRELAESRAHKQSKEVCKTTKDK